MSQGEAAEPPAMRIGTAERDAAMKALNDHMTAGRLGVEEFADRSAIAANATTAAELRALFTDLPAPHPDLGDGVALTKPQAAATPVPAPGGAVAQRREGFIDSWGGRVVAATPIVALIIFAVSGWTWWWIWFLIPLAGALFYGSNEERRRDRDERRDRRDERRGR